MEIPMIENYQPSKIVLGKVDEKYVKFYMSGDGDDYKQIRFQIPKMRIAFDIDNRKSSTGKVFVKNITLSTNDIGSENNVKRIDILRTKLLKTEKYIKRLLPPHLENMTFSHSLWQGKNLDFKPTFKVSIHYDRDDKTKTNVFDSNNNQISDSTLTKGQIVSMAIRLDKLWIYGGKIGINWDVEQIKVYDSQTKDTEKIKGLMIRSDD